jgi:hypothetical protein
MKKEIIKIGNGYCARYKKWYNLNWRYIGINYSHRKPMLGMLHLTEESAIDSLNRMFHDYEVVKSL